MGIRIVMAIVFGVVLASFCTTSPAMLAVILGMIWIVIANIIMEK